MAVGGGPSQSRLGEHAENMRHSDSSSSTEQEPDGPCARAHRRHPSAAQFALRSWSSAISKASGSSSHATATLFRRRRPTSLSSTSVAGVSAGTSMTNTVAQSQPVGPTLDSEKRHCALHLAPTQCATEAPRRHSMFLGSGRPRALPERRRWHCLSFGVRSRASRTPRNRRVRPHVPRQARRAPFESHWPRPHAGAPQRQILLHQRAHLGDGAAWRLKKRHLQSMPDDALWQARGGLCGRSCVIVAQEHHRQRAVRDI